MKILIGKRPPEKHEIEYINEIRIDIKYDNLSKELNEKYNKIMNEIHHLNKDKKIKISTSSSNSPILKDIEVAYSIELKVYQFPSKELSEFYSKFTNFLHGLKGKKTEELKPQNEAENILTKLVKDFEEVKEVEKIDESNSNIYGKLENTSICFKEIEEWDNDEETAKYMLLKGNKEVGILDITGNKMSPCEFEVKSSEILYDLLKELKNHKEYTNENIEIEDGMVCFDEMIACEIKDGKIENENSELLGLYFNELSSFVKNWESSYEYKEEEPKTQNTYKTLTKNRG